ncbi:DUF7344 domain-containing protein [Haladaptatus caseinilyticus]|uniref:DUF7344 domain-containing protein n=1 Tax=Haladaptatus caseinilyticus TaxID=2993314 RepID=UPI00224A5BA9|nr:ArsR family transcriptional regulator [Haladaptatus caseinilyticus]
MPTQDEINTPAPSVVYSTLASARRRLVLTELLGQNQSISVSDLAETIASEESDSDPRRIHAQLHHSHLPKLEDAGFAVVKDGHVTLASHRDTIEPYLVLAERFDSLRD